MLGLWRAVEEEEEVEEEKGDKRGGTRGVEERKRKKQKKQEVSLQPKPESPTTWSRRRSNGAREQPY